jgi:uncharacterized membrane protein YjjP (DUF1212 family)
MDALQVISLTKRLGNLLSRLGNPSSRLGNALSRIGVAEERDVASTVAEPGNKKEICHV